jgi:hypothetical protein
MTDLEILRADIKEEFKKVNNRFDEFAKKQDKMMSSIDFLIKAMSSQSQESMVLTYRQGEHQNVLDDHEERLQKLEAVK